MDANEKKQVDVSFITALSLAVNDVDNQVRHLQISIVQEKESKQFRLYFDVIDPSKIKLADPDELSKSDPVE